MSAVTASSPKALVLPSSKPSAQSTTFRPFGRETSHAVCIGLPNFRPFATGVCRRLQGIALPRFRTIGSSLVEIVQHLERRLIPRLYYRLERTEVQEAHVLQPRNDQHVALPATGE